MVRLIIALLIVLLVLYYTLRQNDLEPKFTYTPPEIITIEILPPIEELNDN